jgi:hypothetical protein
VQHSENHLKLQPLILEAQTVIELCTQFSILRMQVVNGFFSEGNPVRALDHGSDHSPALGVSAPSL